MSGKERAAALCPSAIRCHAWNGAGDQVAVVPNGKEVIIYAVTGDDCRQWQPLHTLAGHDQRVLGVDWHPTTNRLLSCSEDRTACVWELEAGRWEPKMVHLGTAVNRAVLCCSWSPTGAKFAVGTGSNLVSVCHFEAEHSWWVGQTFKAHSSSVTGVAWHPQQPGLLATCSTDCTVRIHAAALKGVDTGESFGKFGTLIAKVAARAWVRACRWAPDGAFLAFVSHDAALSIVDVANDYSVQAVRTRLLPLTSFVFLDAATIVAACHDCSLYVFTRSGTQWALSHRLRADTDAAKQITSVSEAMSKFRLEAATGQASAVGRLGSRHQNVAADLRLRRPAPDWRVASAGYDGQIFLWEPSDIQPL